MTRATIARRLSNAASVLSPEDRRAFRKFLSGLPGATERHAKGHSWRKAKKGKAAPRASRSKQGELFQ